MSEDENSKTLISYEHNVQAYVQGTPQTVDGPYKEWFDHFLSLIPKSGQILEIGSAFGRDADYIEFQGYTVERTDAARGFVKLQQSEGHEARILNAITDEILGPYDLILANAVFLHFTREQTTEVLHKCARALTSNGILAFSVKYGKGSEWKSAKLGAPKFYQYWMEDELTGLVESSGFSIDEVRRINGNKTKWLNITARHS